MAEIVNFQFYNLQFSFNFQCPMLKYDLEDRTLKFATEIVSLCQSLKSDLVTAPIISQLIRAGTSIGANYSEANGASSKKDFKNKIFICKKEAQETKYWLKLISENFPESKPQSQKLWQECQELTLIFHKINSTLGKSSSVV